MNSETERPDAAGKAELRLRLRDARGRMRPEERSAASARIRRRLAALPELDGATVVLGYAAMAPEVDVDALLADLRAGGVAVALPWVHGEHLGLAVVADPARDVRPGWRGVREPRPGLRVRPLRADLVDAAIVPGLGFDARGGRLGYGGGHYDRLLGRLRPEVPVIGVAFDLQIVDALPIGPFDRTVDVVVTETRTLRATTR